MVDKKILLADKNMNMPNHIPFRQTAKYLQKREERENEIHEPVLDVQDS